MNPREAFRTFIRFQMKEMVEAKALDVNDEQIELFADGIEDNPDFYINLNEFLEQEVYDFGENNGFWED